MKEVLAATSIEEDVRENVETTRIRKEATGRKSST
jgi:hypothetical protein